MFWLFAMVYSTPVNITPTTRFPVTYEFGGNPVLGILTDSASTVPLGANLANCTSTKPPVVLVHGTFENQNSNWRAMAPFLANNGRCVYTFNFGSPGIPLWNFSMGFADVTQSAMELERFVSQVLADTRAPKVDIVGHSQGGLIPHLFIRDMGGAARVNKLVALSPSTNGTTGVGSFGARLGIQEAIISSFCVACTQQQFDSPFMTQLRTRPLTVPQVDYTVISTRFDEIVTPVEGQRLPTAPNVRNILLQDVCPGRIVGHVYISYDEASLHLVLNSLEGRNDKIPCNSIPEPKADF